MSEVTESNENASWSFSGPEDSVFASEPQVSIATNDLFDYTHGNSTEQRNVVKNAANRIAQEPDLLIPYIDAVMMSVELKSYKTQEYLAELKEAVGRSKISRERNPLEKWLTILSQGGEPYQDFAERIIANAIERCHDEKSLIDLLYVMSVAGMMSSNATVRSKILEILSYSTNLLSPTKGSPSEKQSVNFCVANFSLDDDVFRKALEIDGAFFFLASQYRKDLLAEKYAAVTAIAGSPDADRQYRKLMSMDPVRFRKIAELYEMAQGDNKVARIPLTEVEDGQFPYNVIVGQAGPLRKWMNDCAIEVLEEGEGVYNFHLPTGDFIKGGLGLDQVRGEVIKGLSGDAKAGEDLSEEMYFKTLSHLAPDEAYEKEVQVQVFELNERLITEMLDHSIYSLSPRGDKVEITDEELRQLGFKSIQYEIRRSGTESKKSQEGKSVTTLVTIAIGNYEYHIELDEFYSLRNIHTGEAINLPGVGEFLRNIILSHLREIKCSEHVNEKLEGSAERTRSAFVGRRGHLRLLPEGQRPGPDRFQLALTHGANLVRRNSQLLEEGVNRQYTFVEPTEVALPGVGPVCSKAPDATLLLQKILNGEKTLSDHDA